MTRQDINNLCIADQMELIRQDIRYIAYINFPNKELQLYALKRNPKAFRLIKNPCIEAQIMAVKHSPDAIR